MDLDIFFEKTKADIERKLEDDAQSYPEHEKLAYFLSHGKRLRSLLSILVFRACGGRESNYESALDLAVAIELQHSASLVHDDIIDGDNKRRSKPSYHKVFGISDAILIGHKAIILGFKKVLGHDSEILDTFFDVWDMSLEGEINDVASRKNPIVLLARDKNRYFNVIINKTASLFAGAAKIGSQKAAAHKELQSLFWEYGKHIGTAYQLADDKLDLTNGSAEELPISWAARSLDEKSFQSIADNLREGQSPAAALSKVSVDFESMFNEEITRMLRLAQNLARDKSIPENKFSPMLLEAPAYIVNRCLESRT